jgi:DHA2 family multidrug resistance protein-like MFS transporter
VSLADQPRSTDPTPLRQWSALAVLMLAVLVISVDNTVLGFAVPALSADLRPSATELLWIVDAYGFVLAGLLVTMGNLGDRIGRRRLLMLGATGFAAASTLAAFSVSPAMLIASRALLGVAGATLMPSTLSLIRTTFPDPATRRVAIGLWASGFAVGSALGPIVGGWLLEHFWWGSVFLLAVPVMGLLVAIGPRVLDESRNDRPGPFDLTSSLLSFGAVLPLVFAMKQLAEHGPAPDQLAIALVGLGVGVVFVRRQRRLDEPMLDVALFGHRPFAAAIFSNFVVNLAFVGAIFLVAQHLQLVVGATPLAAGLHLVPGMAIAFVTSILAASAVRSVRPATILLASMVSAAAGYLVVQLLRGGSDGHWITVAMVLIGAGCGAASSLGTNLVMAIVPARRAGAASAVSETAFELGAATGVAVLGSVTSAVYRRTVSADALDPTGPLAAAARRAADSLAGAVEASRLLDADRAGELLDSAHRAFASGVRAAGLVAAALLGIGALAVWRSLREVAPASAAEAGSFPHG